MEGNNKIPIVGNKPFGRQYGTKRKKFMMDILDMNISKSPDVLKTCPYHNLLRQQNKYNVDAVLKQVLVCCDY